MAAERTARYARTANWRRLVIRTSTAREGPAERRRGAARNERSVAAPYATDIAGRRNQTAVPHSEQTPLTFPVRS